jgi:uncharacterized protein (DUF924 family)
MPLSRPEAILDYWFGNYTDDTELTPESPRVKRWFQGGETVDREVRRLFEADVIKARQGLYKAWENEPKSRLALVLLMDQFPRHIYRDKPKSFEFDEYALELALRSIADGTDQPLQLIERAFLYLPLMHSEQMEVQNRSIQQYRQLAETVKAKFPLNVDYYFYVLDYALKHHAAIQRFGRFPHRNEILGRKSTPEELEYLNGPDAF